MGRWGSTEDDEADYVYVRRPRQTKPRIRIKTDDEAISQRKPREETNTSYENRRDPKALIKRLVLDHPDMTVHEIAKIVGLAGQLASIVAVSNIRTEFKHSIKVLTERGLIKQKRQRES